MKRSFVEKGRRRCVFMPGRLDNLKLKEVCGLTREKKRYPETRWRNRDESSAVVRNRQLFKAC